MDSPKMIKTFKYSPHQQQQQQQQQQAMFSVIEPPPLNRFKSFAQNKSTFEGISFSSYLKSKDPSRNSHENDCSSPSDDAEISIFDAQKYFSENDVVKESQHQQQQASHQDNNLIPSIPRLSSVSSSVDGYGRMLRTRSFHATPTASSEASWNSQTGLLANPPGINGVSVKNFGSYQEKRGSIARKWIFGPKCCCTGKKSVQVKQKVSGSDNVGQANNAKSKILYTKRDCTMSPRSNLTNNSMPLPQLVTSSMHFSPENDGTTLQRRVSASGRAFPDHIPVVGFTFPILNPSQQAMKKGIVTTKTAIIGPSLDPPRESLEVFHPPAHRPGSPILGARDDDVGSDASSDLFEIESFSTQTITTSSYPIMYRRGDSLDDASTFNARRFANNTARTGLDELAAATECYAPSEVSIDWSVTTAEGFDRASVSNFSISASEFGNEACLRRRQEEEEKRKGNNNGGGSHHSGLLLMSCRHEKAVSVGPQPVKCAAAEGIYPVHHGGGRPPRGGGGASNSRLAFVA